MNRRTGRNIYIFICRALPCAGSLSRSWWYDESLTIVLTESGCPAAILPVEASDVVVTSNRRRRWSTSSPKWFAPMMGFATSAMMNFHVNTRRSPRSSRRVLTPWMAMVVPFVANISYVDLSVRPRYTR